MILNQELDKRHIKLDKIVHIAKNATTDPKGDIDDPDNTEMRMYFITCGHKMNSKIDVKHGKMF